MSVPDIFHDAPKTLTDLREHLSRHDKPIAFFFGAGTSCSVQVPTSAEGASAPLIPAVSGLTEQCRQDIEGKGENYKTAWAAIAAQLIERNQVPNVENILSRVRMMLNAVGKGESLAGLNRDEIGVFEESIRKTISKVVTPDLNRIPDNSPHRLFAKWLVKTSRQNPVEIFTLNYDVLFEHALEAERIPIFDGFVGSYRPFFHPDSLRRSEAAPGQIWTRLWKMHGSVTWRRVIQDGRMRVIRGEPDPAGEMILPSFQKYDESRQQPYAAFSDRLIRFLEQDDALLVVSGFSFGDEHINNLIFGALENRARTHVYALQYEDAPESSDLAKRAYQRANMIVIGPQAGIIGGRRANWAATPSPSFLNDVFESTSVLPVDGKKNEGTQTEKSPRVKIGDFGNLSRFLQAMITS